MTKIDTVGGWTLGDDLEAEFDLDEFLLVNPNEFTVKTIIANAFNDSWPRLRILAEEQVMKEARRDFPFATKAADLVDDDQLVIRIVEELPRNSLFLGSDRSVVLVTNNDDVFGVQIDSDDVVSSLSQAYEEEWTNAGTFDLRTPALSRIRESLQDEFDDSFLEEFDNTFEFLGPVSRGRNDIDEVVLVLLITAKRGELLYDIGRWGEELGLASRATFSRTKQQLEDIGLIKTEKVPVDVGRPRMRLHLAVDELEGESGDAFVSRARELIEAGP